MSRLAVLAIALTLAGLSAASAETPSATSAAPAATPAQAPAAIQSGAPAPSRAADLKNAAGGTIGRVELWAMPAGLLIRVSARGLTPGWHGMHLHETGDCSAAAFASAGAHIHSTRGGAHGLLNPNGPEAGDIPNIFIGADGQGSAQVFTGRVTMTPDGDAPGLLDADGSALVIHAAADDQFTAPAGGSGARVACAVIR